MLLDSGWSEAEGLGKDSQGKPYPVETWHRTDRKGLGNELPEARITHKLREPLRVPKLTKTEKKSAAAKRQRLEAATTNDLRKYLSKEGDLNPLESDLYFMTHSTHRKKAK